MLALGTLLSWKMTKLALIKFLFGFNIGPKGPILLLERDRGSTWTD